MNGTLQDLPRNVTFSTTQYAERLAREEPVYSQLSAELLSQPFVFVGSKLDESPLWQHIQLRSTRGGSGLGELRPKSFLVTPHLDKAREVALSQYNVEWIPMAAEQFAVESLSKLEPTILKGISTISKRIAGVKSNETAIPEVSSLLKGELVKTDFLLGSEPIWSDLQAGRAVLRGSDRVDRALNPAQMGGTPIHEYTMPLLSNEDIGSLVDALTNDNKLGKLRGLTRPQQENVFREKAGRELLVAMIEATSGEKFEVKAVQEYEELDSPDKKRIYAVIATATALQFSLTKKDVLIAVGQQDNVVLNALDQLVRRNIIVMVGVGGNYRARHRVLADLVERKLQSAGQLYDVLRGLLIVVAAQVTPEMPRNAKPRRLLVRLINNAFLHDMLGWDHARNLYADLESYLMNEAHFWLQRGVLEVEAGNLRLAKNWLDQAKGISPDDDFVETEYALWEFRTAISKPKDPNARKLVEDASKALVHQIAVNGRRHGHAFHVLGSQCLSWVRHGLDQFEEQRDFLEFGIEKLKEGVQCHPTSDRLKSLLKEMEHERLDLVVRHR